jgi:hypothetical protein
MKRDEWVFEYAASDLAEAASGKMWFHEERLEWWKNKKAEIMDTIRADGLEIDEKISLGYRSPKSRDWEDGARVVVRNDLRKDLDECLEKLAFHTEQLRHYDGWHQVLTANPGARLQLQIEDCLFFFGRV